ncbi:hypothetical protein Golob_027676 [Gossypium lobatum]|uniref:Uncharacterized protein n=1 Tax=Gossypium lobatum TaxID=34289 RepID=A0A7J8NFB7_9ROSI|nr:hypothetical protein [Gossypium lobatum]
MISQKKSRWQFFRIFKKRTLNGELLKCFQMRSYIDVVILTGSLYLGFRELLAMHRDGYKKKIQEMSNAWSQAQQMKRLAVGSITTPEYIKWWGRRINDNIPGPSQGENQPIEKHLRIVPSELEIIKQDFERRNSELEKKIEQMEKEKMNLRLDMDVQKLEVKKLRRGENKAKEDLDSLKTDYKKLYLSMRTVKLGKTSEQWHQKI